MLTEYLSKHHILLPSLSGRGIVRTLCALGVGLLLSCSQKKSYDQIGSTGLTTRTENLQTNLLSFEERGAMLGQMYATAEGIGWQGDPCHSDLHEVTGDNPVVTGYELAGIESGKARNADGIDTTLIRRTAIGFMHRQGLAIMLWTAPNPGANPLESGSEGNERLKTWTLRIASFLGSLHDDYGIKLPVLMYLYPLGTGQWYDRLSADDYRKLYAQTIDWLRDKGETTNAIFGYSNAATSGSAEQFMARCPEQDIDCVQLMYLSSDTLQYAPNLLRMSRQLSAYCSSNTKPLGIYTGLKAMGHNAEFWSKAILPVVEQCRLSYLMLGRNHGDFQQGNYYGPYPGNVTVSDFMKLYNSERTVMAKKLNGLWLKKTE